MSSNNDTSILKSWILTSPDSDFSLQNLPYGIFKTAKKSPRVGVAIGSQILDLSVLFSEGLLKDVPLGTENLFLQDSLNSFIQLGRPVWKALRSRLIGLLRDDCGELRDKNELRKSALVAQSEAEMLLPVKIGDYIDFYSSIEHATNVGKMFRDPANALLPNWKHIPVGYHGRASSVVISGHDIVRPSGQSKTETELVPQFGPSKRLDFELEVGFICGKNNPLGNTITTEEADDFLFGLVLVNDWSARDIQTWEYVPLGPFLAKSFATSISPWIVTMEALEPFRIAGQEQDVPVLPYLKYEGKKSFDIDLEVLLKSERMQEPQVISKSNFKYMYWNMNQQLAHQCSNGTNVRVGDLYASGTISGSTEDSLGSMLELCWKGTRPIALSDGTKRTFIADGDSIIMRGHAQKNGLRVGFGEVAGKVLPAKG